MSKYAFTFKKDNIFVEFITTDKVAVENQFQLWVDNASEYIKSTSKKVAKNSSATQTEKKYEDKKATETKPVEKQKSMIKATEPQKEELQEQVFDKASSLLKTINTIQNPITEDIKVEEIKKFDEVLEESIENPTFEPNKIKDQVFLNLINSKNTNDKFNYLIITAFYLSEFEKKEMFSLKQINAKLMHNLAEVIDHTTLQDAINKGLIELVPDLTGTSEIGEYRLTPQGEEYFANKI